MKGDTELAELAKDIKSDIRTKTRAALMRSADNWHCPEGPGIIKSHDLLSPTGTYGNELMNRVRQSVGLPIPSEWRPIDNSQIIAEVRFLKQKLEDIETKLAKLEGVKIKEFNEEDVYEVNKRVERLEAKVALIISNLTNNRIAKFFLGRFYD